MAEFENPADWVRFLPGALPGVTLMRAHFVDHAFERHSHDTYSIGVTTAGVQTFNCQGARHASLPGDVILFNPDEAHDGRRGSDEGFGYSMVYVDTALVNERLDRDAGTVVSPYFRRPVVSDARAAGAITRVLGAMAQPQESLRAEELMTGLLVGLLRRHGEPAAEGRLLAAGKERMARTRHYIEAHFDEDLSVERLAREAGLSRAHLTRAFAQAHGVPPHIYLNAVRLQRAQQALRAGEPLAAAAAASGFADQSHFSKRFKGAFGVTPGAWLKQMRGG